MQGTAIFSCLPSREIEGGQIYGISISSSHAARGPKELVAILSREVEESRNIFIFGGWEKGDDGNIRVVLSKALGLSLLGSAPAEYQLEGEQRYEEAGILKKGPQTLYLVRSSEVLDDTGEMENDASPEPYSDGKREKKTEQKGKKEKSEKNRLPLLVLGAFASASVLAVGCYFLLNFLL